jgi:DNA-binding IclR family transcriptional regulator
MSTAAIQRLEMLRRFKSREWEVLAQLGLTKPQDFRIVNWLVDKGWLETHPVRFLTHARITDTGFDILAQAGGDVTGWG